MNAIVPVLLQLLGAIGGQIGTTSGIGQIIATLIQITPTVIQEAQDLAPVVKNIIAALQSNGNITQAQLDQLAQLDAQYDQAFEAAATAAQAEDGDN